MALDNRLDVIRWRVHFRSPPEAVYRHLATDEGRARFWAESAPEIDGTIHFRFLNGMVHQGKVLELRPPVRFSVVYFGGSQAAFDLSADGAGGTDLVFTESGVPEAHRQIHLAGWIPVLLALKAAVDFSVDLRNGDPRRTWDDGYVDV